MNRAVLHRAVPIAVTVALAGCGPSRPTLLSVSLPDLSRIDDGVQQQARQRYAALTERINDRNTLIPDLADAYGQFGMLLQAAEFTEAAEPCYLNAQTLAPDEIRWPYYLGHLNKSKGQTAKAEAAFKRALELRPDDFPTLIWLGRLHLDQGRPQDAEPLFTKALAIMPRSVAALAGLGRVALAKREYAAAAKDLEEALSIDPQSESLHSPLAMAYRGLGELDKAQPHLRQWRNTDILLPDPLQQELDLLLESGLSYELRGIRALEAKQWTVAADFFRRGLKLTKENTPLRRSLQHKLGTALYMSGDIASAQEQFEEAVKLAPPQGIDESSAKAHYSLAVLNAEKGRSREATEHLLSAVKYQPSYLEAHLGLADALRRDGNLAAALREYQEAIAINPQSSSGRLGYAMALAGLHREREARDWLDESMKLYPDNRLFPHALARVLVTASDNRVRDGQRAMTIVDDLFKTDKSTNLGETMAMTYAELGQYQRAAAIQRGVIEAAERAGLRDAVRRMQANLQLYDHARPCRVPWRNEDPVHLPAAVPQELSGAAKP